MTMAPVEQRQKVVFNDFSAGIYDDWFASGGALAAPHGAAQVSGTYGCVPGKGGGLIPAPKKIKTQTQALIDATTGTDHKYPTGDYRAHIIGLANYSPVYPNTAGGRGNPTDYPDSVWVALQWWYDSGGVGTTFKKRTYIKQFKKYIDSDGTYVPVNATATNGFAVGTKPSYGYAGFAIGRQNHSSPSTTGRPTLFVLWSHISALPGTGEYGSFAYPSDGSPSTDSKDDMTWNAGLNGPTLFAHQDRIFLPSFGGPTSSIFGIDGGGENTEYLSYTDVNDNLNASGEAISIVNENPFSYGCYHSVNAGELFLVKRRGGAVVIRGDIAYPTIIRLPGCESTGLASNTGCMLPDGTFLYGSERGVYGWNGGDVTRHLSPQLAGWFWKVTTPVSPTAGYGPVDQLTNPQFVRNVTNDNPTICGSFAMCGSRYVFAPNNFCYDTQTNSWWRFSDPSGVLYGWYDQSAEGGRVIAAPYYIDGTQTEVFSWWDPTQGQSSYSWTSQPMAVTMDRVLSFREVSIVTQGAGTVTVTVTGIDGNTDTATFTTTKTAQPEAQTLPLGVQTHDAIVTVTSNSNDSSVPAPRLYRFSMEYIERATARAASS